MSDVTFEDLAAVALTERPQQRCRCGKLGMYETRKDARRDRRRIFPGTHMRVYQCFNGVWHFGRLPGFVSSAPSGTLRVRPPTSALVGIQVVAHATLQESA